MWLLSMLKKYNAADLYRMGLKIPVEQISGGTGNVLSEAVVSFGSGCTGSLISDQGLIVTNYHCSYGAIQQHTSIEKNISDRGFWAASFKEELPVSGLKITVTKKIVDISEEMLALTGKDKQSPLSSRDALAVVTKKYQQQFPACKISTRSYRNNTIYVLYVQLDYNDVRLVGLAPKNIAKFGGETDNWMWPRYCADFAFFRVYTNVQGRPAQYSTSNIPLKATGFLKVSTAGYKKGDFAMSMGFPGRSDRYSTSYQVYEKRTAQNPPLIAVRKLRLAVLEEEMAKNDTVRIAYAEKYSTAANYYKNAVGMDYWIDKLDIIGKKKKEEVRWVERLSEKGDTFSPILNGFSWLDQTMQESITPRKALNYYVESFNETCDMIRFISVFASGFKHFEKGVQKNPGQRKDYLANVVHYYSRFNPAVDKRLTKSILLLLKDSLPAAFLPDIFETKQLYSAARINQYVDAVFEESVFSDSARINKWIAKPYGNIEADPAYLLVQSIDKKQREIARQAQSLNSRRGSIYTGYEEAINSYSSGKYYPDADYTMRLSYGTVCDLNNGTATLPFQTTLGGLIGKEDAFNKDYVVNPLLKEMWQKKAFGIFSGTRDIPVCFITDGDVTGGNSGSPMLNASGNLIGLVFDCNWESMTREFNYDQSLHRVICTDIRYVLYLTEQLSGNKKLMNEIMGS